MGACFVKEYKKYKPFSLLCLIMFSVSSFASSNPASTSYVRNAIANALSQLVSYKIGDFAQGDKATLLL